MKKELYTAPEMEIIAFETEDVITTSPLVNGGPGGTPDEVDYSDLF